MYSLTSPPSASASPQVGNVGIIFTKAELADLKEEIEKYKVGAPARVGLLAPNDVHIPSGTTGMDPSQTSFFQALGIATKINKGTIEITQSVHLIHAGERVSASQATLLGKLGIKPFQYGLVTLKVSLPACLPACMHARTTCAVLVQWRASPCHPLCLCLFFIFLATPHCMHGTTASS